MGFLVLFVFSDQHLVTELRKLDTVIQKFFQKMARLFFKANATVLVCLWQCFFGRALSQIKLHNEYFMGSWTDPRESPFFCDYGLLSWPLSLWCLLCQEKKKKCTTGQLWEMKNTKPCPFLSRIANLHLNGFLFRAAVALWIFLVIASLHIPPTSLYLSLLSLLHTSPSLLLPVCTMLLYAVYNTQKRTLNPGNGQSWVVTLLVTRGHIQQPVLL